MKMLMLLSLVALTNLSYAQSKKVDMSSIDLKVGASARIRSEYKSDTNLASPVVSYADTTSTRIRFDITASSKKSNKWNLFFQPQFTRFWGRADIAGAPASGGLNDTSNDVHQAYMNINTGKTLSFKIGRQEIAYGEHLVIGTVGWHQVGRSFDAVKMKYKHKFGWVDVFNAKMKENGSTFTGNKSLTGLYSSMDFGKYLNTFDVYAFLDIDHSGAAAVNENEVTAVGSRIKSKYGKLDIRAEYTVNSGDIGGVDLEDASQMDVEIGYSVRAMKSRLSFEYFSAEKNYRELYPTGHKWLGFADHFSRRNITGLVTHLKLEPSKKLVLKIDHHIFNRDDKASPIYKMGSGAAIGTGAETASDDIGTETDVTLIYKMGGGLKMTGVYAKFSPGDHMEALNGSDSVDYGYLEISGSF